MSTSKRAKHPAGKDRAKNKTQKAKGAQDWKITALRVLALLAVIGISILVFLIRDRVKEFAAFGYPGIFLIALVLMVSSTGRTLARFRYPLVRPDRDAGP